MFIIIICHVLDAISYFKHIYQVVQIFNLSRYDELFAD